MSGHIDVPAAGCAKGFDTPGGENSSIRIRLTSQVVEPDESVAIIIGVPSSGSTYLFTLSPCQSMGKQFLLPGRPKPNITAADESVLRCALGVLCRAVTSVTQQLLQIPLMLIATDQ